VPKQGINILGRYRILDLLVWATVFFLWKEYYRLVDPPQMIWIFAAITTSFAAFAFYLTYYILVPGLLNKKGVFWFVVSVCVVVSILAGIRSGTIYTAFNIVLPGSKYWNFFRSITASSFHIGYAITLATLIRLFIHRYETQKKLDIIIKENLQTELNYLKAQINPHFLFNIYNSIYFLIEENPRLASTALLKLSGIMQYQLYDCNKEMVELEKEIENIKNYVELETMRVEETVNVHFTNQVVNSGKLIAPFILLTLIENAFKHVSKEGNSPNSVSILLSHTDNWMEMKIKNTMNGGDLENVNGIGLVNVKRRLELMYPGKHELRIYKQDGFYSTILKLQL
jgi:two-component system, LytTR family, sensor kinase